MKEATNAKFWVNCERLYKARHRRYADALLVQCSHGSGDLYALFSQATGTVVGPYRSVEFPREY